MGSSDKAFNDSDKKFDDLIKSKDNVESKADEKFDDLIKSKDNIESKDDKMDACDGNVNSVETLSWEEVLESSEGEENEDNNMSWSNFSGGIFYKIFVLNMALLHTEIFKNKQETKEESSSPESPPSAGNQLQAKSPLIRSASKDCLKLT